DAQCPGGETCVAGCAACGNGFVDPGEECDEGAGNRDAPNHCRPDCTLPHCGDATLDFPHCAGDPDTACTTEDCPAGAACEPGEGDRCTVDSCAGAGGCRHAPLGYDAIAASLAPSLELQACNGQRIPPAIGRLMKQARKLVERAAHARRPKRAEDIVRRALGK